ncbi:MAG: leucine-rich repeat protein [Clostridiales bacterium]|nr:leucine-rich repeat protein [Clostridiales bacterium]
MPSSVTSLGERVFYGCSALTTATINANITEIPEGAFQSCKSLTSINIPSSVTSVGDYAFKYCYALPEISLPNGLDLIGYEAFMKCTGFTSVTIPSAVSEIGNGAFEGCTSMTSFTIQTGGSEKIIEANAFKDCTALKSAVIPSTVTVIKANAFNGCETLANLTLSEGLTSIGKNAFYRCTALKAVEIPGSVTNIGEDAFGYDSALTSLALNEGLLTIGDYAFGYCSSISGVSIPGTVTTVGNYVFAGCKNMSSLTILKGSEEKTIGNSAFSGCTSLTKVSLPETVTNVGDYAFGGCTALYTLSLSEGLTSVGSWAFQLCSRLPEISIPSTVTSIGEGAFTTCNGLTTVYCYEGSAADDVSLYPKGVTISYLTVTVTPPSFEVTGVFGGRNVKFSSTPYMAEIYYSYTTSNITTDDICVSNGETVLFENFYGTIYAKAYYDGKWSNVSRLILKIPTVNTPTITVNGTKATIKSSTPSAYIYYTTDGTTPSLSNGTNLGLNGGTINVNDDDVIKAIAVRSCFTNSEVSSYGMPNAFDGTVYPTSFTVVGAFGGRNVTFKSNTSKAKIYYSSTTSSLTTSDKCIENGETVLFKDFYGTIYARAYYNGVWSNVSRLILKIPTINAPVITYDEGKVTIRTSTPNCYIYYTTDGSTPSMANGKKLCSDSYGQIIVSSGTTVKAIAVRSCFTNSSVVTYKVS